MSIPRAKGAARSAAVFSLCALFAVLAMGLTLLASSVYRSTVAEAGESYTQRVALSYLINQIRRSDEAGGVALSQFGGSDALALTERLDGAEYQTLLYCYDGALRELYIERGADFPPEDGFAILPLEKLSLTEQDGLIQITVRDAGGSVFSACVAQRSAFEEVGGP